MKNENTPIPSKPSIYTALDTKGLSHLINSNDLDNNERREMLSTAAKKIFLQSLDFLMLNTEEPELSVPAFMTFCGIKDNCVQIEFGDTINSIIGAAHLEMSSVPEELARIPQVLPTMRIHKHREQHCPYILLTQYYLTTVQQDPAQAFGFAIQIGSAVWGQMCSQKLPEAEAQIYGDLCEGLFLDTQHILPENLNLRQQTLLRQYQQAQKSENFHFIYNLPSTPEIYVS